MFLPFFQNGTLISAQGLRRAFSDGGRALLAATLVIGSTSDAHHSGVMYDDKQEISHEGKVAKFLWANPHVFVILDVPTKDGTTRSYSFEAPSPAYLKRHGWNHSSVKVGDQVKVVSSPLRDGRPGGLLFDVIYSNGRKLDTHYRLGSYKFDKDGKQVLDFLP